MFPIFINRRGDLRVEEAAEEWGRHAAQTEEMPTTTPRQQQLRTHHEWLSKFRGRLLDNDVKFGRITPEDRGVLEREGRIKYQEKARKEGR